MSRPTRGAGAFAEALTMRAVDSGDTEGAELPPVDAEEKNMAGDGKKRRVERTHDPSRHSGVRTSQHGAGASAAALMMRAVGTDTEVAEVVANTQGETKTDPDDTKLPPPPPPPPPPPGWPWTEFKRPDGKVYYFNTATSKSQYDKPDDLKTEAEKAMKKCPWIEFTNAADQRKYWHNSDTNASVWDEPAEYTEHKAAVSKAKDGPTAAQAEVQRQIQAAQQARQQAQPASSGSTVPPPTTPFPAAAAAAAARAAPAAVVPVKKVKVPSVDPPAWDPTSDVARVAAAAAMAAAGNTVVVAPVRSIAVNERPSGEKKASKKAQAPQVEPKYANKEERRKAFDDLLREKECDQNVSWSDASRKLMSDVRYKALKTLGEKKQYYAEFQGQCKKAEKETRRKNRKLHKEGFRALLIETTTLTSRTKWRQVMGDFEADERYTRMDARDAEDVFEDYLDEMARAEREIKRKKMREAEEKFKDILTAAQEKGLIKDGVRWRDVEDPLAEMVVAGGEDFEACKILDRRERMAMYDEVIRDVEKKALETRRAAQEKKDAEERAARQAFRDEILYELKKGTITPFSRWKDFKQAHVDDVWFRGMEEIRRGASSHDIFDDILDAAVDALKGDTHLVARTLKDKGGFVVQADSVLATFEAEAGKIEAAAAEAAAEKEKEKKEGEGAKEDAEGKEGAKDKEDKEGKEGKEGTEGKEGKKGGETKEGAAGAAGEGGVVKREAKDLWARSAAKSVADVRARAANQLSMVFEDLLRSAQEEEKRAQRRMKKYIERFQDLLDDSFYRSSDIGMSWEDAVKKLSGRSAYVER